MIKEFKALLKAGVVELRTSGEMKAVCDRIVARGNRHPNWLQAELPNRRLLVFLKFCQKQQINLDTAANCHFAIQRFKREY